MHRVPLGICVLVLSTVSVLAQQPGGPVGSGVPRARAAAPAGRAAAPARVNTPTVLPGTPETAFSTILGNALDSTNRVLPDAPVRLRDARAGRIVDSQLTDKVGLFTFRTVDPGSYVIELLSANDNTVLAATQVLSVNAGEALSAVVKLPFRLPPFAGLLGHNVAQAATIAGAAAATGVLTQAATVDVSPDRPRGQVR